MVKVWYEPPPFGGVGTDLNRSPYGIGTWKELIRVVLSNVIFCDGLLFSPPLLLYYNISLSFPGGGGTFRQFLEKMAKTRPTVAMTPIILGVRSRVTSIENSAWLATIHRSTLAELMR
jgi:hypothetical protein